MEIPEENPEEETVTELNCQLAEEISRNRRLISEKKDLEELLNSERRKRAHVKEEKHNLEQKILHQEKRWKAIEVELHACISDLQK